MAPLDGEPKVEQLNTIDNHVEDAKGYDTRRVDEALAFLTDSHNVGEVHEVDEKKLMRRVDWMLMPLMFACYYLQYSDKTLCMSGVWHRLSYADIVT